MHKLRTNIAHLITEIEPQQSRASDEVDFRLRTAPRQFGSFEQLTSVMRDRRPDTNRVRHSHDFIPESRTGDFARVGRVPAPHVISVCNNAGRPTPLYFAMESDAGSLA